MYLFRQFDQIFHSFPEMSLIFLNQMAPFPVSKSYMYLSVRKLIEMVLGEDLHYMYRWHKLEDWWTLHAWSTSHCSNSWLQIKGKKKHHKFVLMIHLLYIVISLMNIDVLQLTSVSYYKALKDLYI